jgi:hypothetical protein
MINYFSVILITSIKVILSRYKYFYKSYQVNFMSQKWKVRKEK